MASLSWSLDLTGTELSVVSVGVLVTSSCFGDGKVVWVLCGDNDVVLLTPGNQSNFYRVKNFKKQSHIIHNRVPPPTRSNSPTIPFLIFPLREKFKIKEHPV